MPFKSEAQRKYLWANEPEIARDWTDTYGSKIHAANGGIMRLPFAEGEGVDYADNDIMVKVELLREQYPDKYHEDMVSDEEMVEMVKANEGEETIGIGERITSGIDTMRDKFTGGGEFIKKLPGMAIGALAGIPGAGLLMQGLRGPQLTPQQIQMNKNYMANYGVTKDQTTGRMIGGPFQGMNAPGMSAMGSRTSKEMAEKWMNKYGDINYQTPAQQQKQQTIKNMATMNQGPAGIIPQAPAQMNMGSGDKGQHTTQSAGQGPAPQRDYNTHSAYGLKRGGIAGLWPR